MQKDFKVTSSPHLRDSVSTRSIMLDVCIALIPAGLASVYFFGLRSLILIAVAVCSAVFAEWFYQRHTHQKVTTGDLSAVVTGLLLAYNLPANAPWWVAAVGSIIAIVLVKQIFGGIGQNFMNPALAARAILFASYLVVMSKYPEAQPGQWLAGLVPESTDVVSAATALSSKSANLIDLFLGNVPGVLGETSKLALLLGGVYLMFRHVISWRIPVCFIGTVFICYTIYGLADPATTDFAAALTLGLYEILSGGLFLGAFFMATDYASSPVSNTGKLIMGVGCGLLVFVIRAFASYPEGCSYAILFMNVVTPLIDKATKPRSFGRVKKNV